MSELVLGVSAVREATPGSRIVRLDLNGAPFSHEPGQAAAIGPAELSARVPFSIASAPEETRQLGSIEFLMVPPFVSTVLRRLCEVLDQASSAAHDFDDLTSTIEEVT